MRLFLFLSLFLVFAQPVFAQNEPASQSGQIDDLLGKGKVIENPTTIRDYTNVFYAQCAQAKHPTIGGRDLERLCRCTAEKYSEIFTVDQIREMETNSSEGRFQNLRLLSFAYAPCIQKPTYQMLMGACMRDVRNQYLMKNQSNTCHCIADNISSQIAEYVPQVIESKTREGKKIDDPIGLFLHPKVIETRSYYFNDICIKRHEPR